jgi:hypothetical protein
MNKSIWLFLFAAVPLSSLAQEEPLRFAQWYAGGGLSFAEITAGSFGGINNGSDDAELSTGSVITAGYEISRHVAIEAGYLDTGTLRYSGRRGFICRASELCDVSVEQEASALTLSGVGILPLSDVWEIYAKLGLASWEAVSKQAFRSPSGSLSATGLVDLDGTDVLFGFGIGAWLNPGLRVRLGYESFSTNDALLAVDRAAGLQHFALEVHWRFGGRPPP